MSFEQMRDEFESALAAYVKLPHGQAQFKSFRSDDRFYANAHGVVRAELEIGWWAWRASRAELVVTLPEPDMIEISAEESLEMDPEEYEALEARNGAQWSMIRKCRKAIEAAGVKVAQ